MVSIRLRLAWEDPATHEPRDHIEPLPFTLGRGQHNALVLNSGLVSRQHASMETDGESVIVVDHNSLNGTFVNEDRITRSVLETGDTVCIGPFSFSVGVELLTPEAPPDSAAPAKNIANDKTTALRKEPAPPSHSGTLIFQEETDLLMAPRATPSHADFPPAAFAQEKVSVDALRESGFEVDETTYLAVGGGMGSFAWVDHLTIFGADPAQIASIGLQPKPYGRYQSLCQQSQIPLHERIRSNTESFPDNLWGWPGYAGREMWARLKSGELRSALELSWQLFGEPDLTQTYTPRLKEVFASIDRESARIGWDRIWRYGNAKALRKTDDGRYVLAYTRTGEQEGRRHGLMVAPYVHLAVGYPGIRLLGDLQAYREETQDSRGVVNAYEDHEHVYRQLREQGGIVLVRGRGIVASRIIQRLYETRQKNPRVSILHLMRSPKHEGARFRQARRQVEHHWEYQPFNWPKSCWGGDYKVMLEKASPPQREQLLNDWGGTTTALRSDWQHIVLHGLREGWYQIRVGDFQQVHRDAEGKLVTQIRGKSAVPENMSLTADFVIDCTGLVSDLDDHPFPHDLVTHYHLPRNPKGRLEVANDMELDSMRNGSGRMYAAGIMTLGGPYAGVDTFLGLQYAAMRATDGLCALRAPGLGRLNGWRSMRQWGRWARGVKP